MEGDVQQDYLAAEQAYGEGDFDQAEAIASALLSRLDITTSSGAEEEPAGWTLTVETGASIDMGITDNVMQAVTINVPMKLQS